MINEHTRKTQQLQLGQNNTLRHLLDLEGLQKHHLEQLMDTASSFQIFSSQNPNEVSIRKVPLLRGKTVINLFFENSTRTRITFQIAAKKLSADFIDWHYSASSVNKGETLLDTVGNIEAMHADIIVLRHHCSGSSHFVASHCKPNTIVINAGDGCHAHPTQALLDLYTIRENKKDFANLNVAIVGDLRHSRVARSLCHGLSIMGCRNIRLVSPPLLRSQYFKNFPGAQIFSAMDEGIADCDVVVVLRLQLERMQESLFISPQVYARDFGLNEARMKLTKPDCLVMHPGPINRGVEITEEVADGKNSVIMQQVSNGIITRMAAMVCAVGNQDTHA